MTGIQSVIKILFKHVKVRVSEHLVGRLKGHEGEVCGIGWSQDGQAFDHKLFFKNDFITWFDSKSSKCVCILQFW